MPKIWSERLPNLLRDPAAQIVTNRSAQFVRAGLPVPRDADESEATSDFSLAACFTAAFFTRNALLFSLCNALRTFLHSPNSLLSTLGNRRSNLSSAPTMADPTTTRANHVWSAGTMYHGASSEDVWRIMSW